MIQDILRVINTLRSNTDALTHPSINKKIEYFIKHNRPIQFVLPAFPCKSANPLKTEHHLPDYGEYLCLKKLNEACEQISNHYAPGAEIMICSDGRVFSDLVLVDDDALNAYRHQLQNMIATHQFNHLTWFDLDQVFVHDNYDQKRQALIQFYGSSLDEIPKDYLFNGIHRFIYEDRLALVSPQSKNRIRQESKQIALLVIQRSNAWSKLIEQYFPHHLRLSIHPHPASSDKIGIQLLNADTGWATPWHNVVVTDGTHYTLTHRHKAVAAGAKPTVRHGYALYQIGACHESA